MRVFCLSSCHIPLNRSVLYRCNCIFIPRGLPISADYESVLSAESCLSSFAGANPQVTRLRYSCMHVSLGQSITSLPLSLSGACYVLSGLRELRKRELKLDRPSQPETSFHACKTSLPRESSIK